jgi:hypothetical protein
MKIIHKDKWGFWFFVRYNFIVEDDDESLTELTVSKDLWLRFNVGDYYDPLYDQYYKYDQSR